MFLLSVINLKIFETYKRYQTQNGQLEALTHSTDELVWLLGWTWLERILRLHTLLGTKKIVRCREPRLPKPWRDLSDRRIWRLPQSLIKYAWEIVYSTSAQYSYRGRHQFYKFTGTFSFSDKRNKLTIKSMYFMIWPHQMIGDKMHENFLRFPERKTKKHY